MQPKHSWLDAQAQQAKQIIYSHIHKETWQLYVIRACNCYQPMRVKFYDVISNQSQARYLPPKSGCSDSSWVLMDCCLTKKVFGEGKKKKFTFIFIITILGYLFSWDWLHMKRLLGLQCKWSNSHSFNTTQNVGSI